MKYLLFFYLIISCSHKMESPAVSLEHSFWDKLERISSPLTPESIKEHLGEPTLKESLNENINWSYINVKTKLQNWKVELDFQRNLKKISYFPSADGVVFTTQSIQKHGSAKNCLIKKIETLTLSHSHPFVGKMICENGKYILYFDREDQIQEVELH